MRQLILLLLLSGAAFGQTFNGGTVGGNILPDQTGRTIGNATYRWNGFFQELDVLRNTGVRTATSFPGSDIGAQINSAIADCSTAIYAGATGTFTGYGCEVYVPAGSYTLSTPIQYLSGIKIRGAGRGSTRIALGSAINKSMVLMGVNAAEDGLPSSVIGYLELSDLTLDGNAANQSGTSYCIHMGRAGRVSIHDVQYQNCRNAGIVWDNGNNAVQAAIAAVGADGLGVVVIDHVFGLGPQTGGSNSDGIYDWGGNDFRITRMDYNALNASGNRYGVHLRDVGDVAIENSWVSTATNYGIYLQHADRTRVESTFVDSGSVQGIYIGDSGSASTSVTLTGNHVTNAKSAVPQIELNGCTGCRIMSNVANGTPGTYGLLLDNVATNSDVQETGNYFQGNATGTISDAGGKLIVTLGGQVRTGISGNTDLVGQLQLSTGTATYNFKNSSNYTTAPLCVCSDATASNACSVPTITTSAVTFNGTGTDFINYICIGRN